MKVLAKMIFLLYFPIIVCMLLERFFGVSVPTDLQAVLMAFCWGLYFLCEAVICYLRTALKGCSIIALFVGLAMLAACVVGLMELNGLIHLPPPPWGNFLALLLSIALFHPVRNYYRQDRNQHPEKYKLVRERSLLDVILLRFPDLRHLPDEQGNDSSEDDKEEVT